MPATRKSNSLALSERDMRAINRGRIRAQIARREERERRRAARQEEEQRRRVAEEEEAQLHAALEEEEQRILAAQQEAEEEQRRLRAAQEEEARLQAEREVEQPQQQQQQQQQPQQRQIVAYVDWEWEQRSQYAHEMFVENPKPVPHNLRYTFTKKVKKYAIDHHIKLDCGHYQFFVYNKCCTYFPTLEQAAHRFRQIFGDPLPSIFGPERFQKRYHFKDWDAYIYPADNNDED